MKTLEEIEEEIRATVLDLVQTFGLHVDLDQWNEKGWIRVKSNDWPEDFGYRNNCLILYRDDVKQLGMQYVNDELIQNLIHLGGNLKAKEIRKTLNL
jgi:hypothetical protein